MRKIRLDIEALDVESYVPSDVPVDRGTVHGQVTAYWELCVPTQTQDPNVNTCGPTQNTCPYTCDDRTCYQCGTVQCQPSQPNTCTGTCCPMEPPTHP